MYATTKTAMILYGMGVCQFTQAVDVVKGLANLALMTGNFGGPSMGIGPVRGQNNVQEPATWELFQTPIRAIRM